MKYKTNFKYKSIDTELVIDMESFTVIANIRHDDYTGKCETRKFTKNKAIDKIYSLVEELKQKMKTIIDKIKHDELNNETVINNLNADNNFIKFE